MNELEVREWSDGRREYLLPNGVWVPSMTTVISEMGDKTHLDAWRNRIGHEAARKYTAVRAKVGNDMHDAFEQYMRNTWAAVPRIASGGMPKQTMPMVPTTKEALNRVKWILDQLTPIHLEEQFWSEKFRIAGRCDMIAMSRTINRAYSVAPDDTSIVDYKSYREHKTPEQLHDYFVQMAGYAVMSYDCGKMEKLPKTLVLIAPCLDSPGPQIQSRRVGDYLRPLNTLVKGYWRKKENADALETPYNIRPIDSHPAGGVIY